MSPTSNSTLGLALFFALAPAAVAAAQESKIDAIKCKDVMRSSDSEREATIAYLHGFLNGKAGITALDVDALSKQTDAMIDRCLDNPGEEALKAMESSKK
jgi:hypothetical protein